MVAVFTDSRKKVAIIAIALQRSYAAGRYGYARPAALRGQTVREIIEAPFITEAPLLTSEGMNLTRSAASAYARPRRAAVWLMLSVLAAVLGWLAFRGYLNPELLFHFANSLYC
jgi:hypothetical protein